MTTPKPWVSGFCNASNPPDSHERCKREHDGVPCTCSCHTDTSPAQADQPDAITAASTPEGSSAGEARHGVHRNVDEEAYHRDTASLSSSGAKLLANVSVTPAEFRYLMDHPTFKKVFDFGHAAHAKVLGAGAEIRVIPDEILASNGATSTKAAKEFIAQARADGAVPIKSDDARKVDAMAAAIEDHAEAFRLLSSGEAEVSAWAECPDTGIMRRARADWLRAEDGEVVDYKTVAGSVSPHEFARTAARLGYDQQDPWYRDVFGDAGLPVDRFFFISQMKEPPYAVAVHELDEASAGHGRYLNHFAASRFAEHTATGDWPGHSGINLIRTPTWRHLYDPASLTATIPDDFTWSPDD